MNKQKVAVGLSGGVDSAIAAYLLKKRGYTIYSIFMNCFDDDVPGYTTAQDRKDALAVAIHLGLPFKVLDFRKEYKSSVIDYFKKEYLAGRTPNPDVVCNRDIKFGLFLEFALKEGFDYVATGHYADVPRFLKRSAEKSAGTPAPANNRSMPARRPAALQAVNEQFSKRLEVKLGGSRASNEGKANAKIRRVASPLRIPKDRHKDQTYFLWAVPREKFRRVLFPLGDITKKEVRSLAKDVNIPVANKPDSTGICFVGDVSVVDFLKRLGVKEQPGEVVLRSKKDGPFSERSVLNRKTDYEVIGRHRGVPFYTIGQRRGFSVTKCAEGTVPSVNRPPLYVVEKDIIRNRLVVGFGAETFTSQFNISDANWLVDPSTIHYPQSTISCYTRIRHGGELIPASLKRSVLVRSVLKRSVPAVLQGRTLPEKRLTIDDLRLTVRLKEPQRGLAPGQSAVFYLKDGTVLGGGVIQ